MVTHQLVLIVDALNAEELTRGKHHYGQMNGSQHLQACKAGGLLIVIRGEYLLRMVQKGKKT